MQPGLRIKVLALETQVVFDLRHFLLQHIAIRPIAGAPDDAAFPVGHLLRGAEVIQVVEVNLIPLDKAQRFEASRFVQVELFRMTPFFAQQYIAIPQEFGFAECIAFAYAAAQRMTWSSETSGNFGA